MLIFYKGLFLDKSKHSSEPNGSTQGFRLLTLFTPCLTSQGSLAITSGREDDWKIEPFGVLVGVLFAALEESLMPQTPSEFSPRTRTSCPIPPVCPPPSSKAPGALRPSCLAGLSPCGFAAPSSSKEGNTTKLQNKPTTETPNKLVGEPAASPKEEAHFLLQNSALLRNFLMTSPRQTTSSSM